MSIKETRMIARAIKQRWEVPDEIRPGLIKAMVRIVAGSDSSPREKITAFKAILSAEKQNQDDEHKLIDVQLQYRDDEILSIAAELGVDPAIIFDVEVTAGRRIAIGEESQERDDSGQGH
jgi:hypothetical protein